MIELVDADFDHPTSSLKFDVLSRGRGPALFGLVFIIFATVLLSTVSQGAPQDIKLSTCALVIAADALAFTLILATESAPRGRLIEGSAHFKRLRNATIEPLILGALVKMRVSLPPGANLKRLYEIDRAQFAQANLIQRALAPLQ